MNTLLQNAHGTVSMYFRPEAANTIKSMERTVWKEANPDTAQIEKSFGDEHHSDGIRYATEYLFPVQGGKKRVVRNTSVLI